MIEEGQSDSQEIRGHIKGELLYTIYENESENFTIAKIKVLETTEKLEEKEIVAKGYFCTMTVSVSLDSVHILLSVTTNINLICW